MTFRLTGLSGMQIRALAQLDDGHVHEDSVGRLVSDLSDEMLIACYELQHLGLAECMRGWNETFWYRLTEAGRKVREG